MYSTPFLTIILSLQFCSATHALLYSYDGTRNDPKMIDNITILDIPDEATTIIIRNSLIHTLPSGFFAEKENCTWLLLSSNNISVLEPDAFLGLGNLDYLSLAYGSLKVLKSQRFNHLAAMENLQLLGNDISSVESDAFFGLGHLSYLYLMKNKLDALTSGMFQHLVSLSALYLDENQIASIGTDSFLVSAQWTQPVNYFHPQLSHNQSIFWKFLKVLCFNFEFFLPRLMLWILTLNHWP